MNLPHITGAIRRATVGLRTDLQKCVDEPKGASELNGPLYRMGITISKLEAMVREIEAGWACELKADRLRREGKL